MKAQCLLECYYGERLLTNITAQSFDHSFTSDESTGRNCCQAWEGDNLFQMIENHERNDALNVRQMQAIRALGANLRRMADCMHIRSVSHCVDINQTVLLKEGLSDEEIQVVRRIYAERTAKTISNIARNLQACLTSQTFRMTLEFLSNSSSSASEELAAVCELVRLLYPRVQEAIQAGPIYDELKEFIENRLDEVLH